MSLDGWNTVLVLGGIRSGKSAYAESLVADAAAVRYIATAVSADDDAEWRARIDAHRRRRPPSWTTEETGADPDRLAKLLAGAKPRETLLVDDLGGWVSALLDPMRQPNDDQATVATLADAVRACRARLVLVSPEVGLSLVPMTPLGRAFADAVGTANQALAAACDRVVLVVAGQPTVLKPAAPGSVPSVPATAPHTVAPHTTAPHTVAPLTVAPPAPTPAGRDTDQHRTQPMPASADVDPLHAPTVTLPLLTTGAVIHQGMELPLPDTDAGPDARDRLALLDLPGTGLGAFTEAVEFAAATQGTPVPRPWQRLRVALVQGVYEGGTAAGTDGEDARRRLAQVAAGEGPLARLAMRVGADLAVVSAPTTSAMEAGPALEPQAVDAALNQGWQLAERAAADGVDALVLASLGVGADAAAAAVVASTADTEAVAVLGRVVATGGRIDDAAWMTRAATLRDALHRTRHSVQDPRQLLSELGGGVIAVATGIVLGAAARRLPVLLDGPVGVAAALTSREFSNQARHWCLLADHGNHPAVRQGAELLGLTTILTVGLDLGEGANALALLPTLQTALMLAATLPPYPGPSDSA